MSLVVDQQQTRRADTQAGFGEFANVRYRGQVFTPAQARVDGLLFYFQHPNANVGVKITFCNVNQTTNLPTTDIYSFVVSPSQLTGYKYNRVLLPAAITTLTPGTKYGVYFAPWNPTTNLYQDAYRDLKWSTVTADYVGGVAIRNDGGTWSVESNRQLYFQLFYDYTMPTYTPSYTQPSLPTPTKGFNFNSVDAQITSKHWMQDSTKIANEVAALVALGCNYIAHAAPYDNPVYYKMWCDAIHNAGKKVMHRAHFNGWEGDNDYTVHVTGDEYQARFYKFVQDNAACFATGDSVAIAVEANQADTKGNLVFRTSGSFDFTKYNNFQKAQVHVANKAFADASITGVHTWAISHSLSLLDLNGQTLDSGDGGNTNGLDASDITTYFANRLSIDHYLSDSYRQSNSDSWIKYGSDIDKIKTAFPAASVMCSEIGYHTTTNVSDDEQYAWYDSVLTTLRMRDRILGINAWNHMGQSQSSLFTDSSGAIATPGRPATEAIKQAFNSYNATRGWA